MKPELRKFRSSPVLGLLLLTACDTQPQEPPKPPPPPIQVCPPAPPVTSGVVCAPPQPSAFCKYAPVAFSWAQGLIARNFVFSKEDEDAIEAFRVDVVKRCGVSLALHNMHKNSQR